ncbi:hypothetical protein V5O48_013848 [Marasmius crinis-equi]|uniref:Uncharacterized protein n=1 Tax=Marasmius crinis-equi TaxID=585013 RepID=A0ABR3EYX8_9AGAR
MTSASPYRDYFRRPSRTIGRAASPPTWACYEQISYDDEYSDADSCSDSCSEDDEDYACGRQGGGSGDEGHSESDEEHVASMRERENHVDDGTNDIDMDMDGEVDEAAAAAKKLADKDVKGKQKAIVVDSDPPEPEPEPQPIRMRDRQRRRPQRERPVHPLRPILTIHRSQGFVWNQDLFIPPYIKDRYVASSPPNSSGFVSTSVSSTNSVLSDYEVEVVEIRVQEGELNHIIP